MPENATTRVRKFGIEVEFGGADSGVLPRLLVELRNAGLSTATSLHGYIGNSDREWVVKTDGSVRSVGGGELVSPPLEFDNPEHRTQVYRAMDAIRRAGGVTAPEAGVHVHIDASDLSPQQVAYVARSTTRFEDCIYRLASSGWRTMRPGAATYAKPLPEPMVQRLAKCTTDEQLRRAWYGRSAEATYMASSHGGGGTRYYALNLHSWFYRGTVEFRFFNSTLNAKRALGYVVLCNGIVQDARDGNRRTVKTKAMRLGHMLNGTITEKQARHRLMQMLRWEATTPCSKADLDLVAYCWKDSKPQPLPDQWRRDESYRGVYS